MTLHPLFRNMVLDRLLNFWAFWFLPVCLCQCFFTTCFWGEPAHGQSWLVRRSPKHRGHAGPHHWEFRPLLQRYFVAKLSSVGEELPAPRGLDPSEKPKAEVFGRSCDSHTRCHCRLPPRAGGHAPERWHHGKESGRKGCASWGASAQSLHHRWERLEPTAGWSEQGSSTTRHASQSSSYWCQIGLQPPHDLLLSTHQETPADVFSFAGGSCGSFCRHHARYAKSVAHRVHSCKSIRVNLSSHFCRICGAVLVAANAEACSAGSRASVDLR